MTFYSWSWKKKKRKKEKGQPEYTLTSDNLSSSRKCCSLIFQKRAEISPAKVSENLCQDLDWKNALSVLIFLSPLSSQIGRRGQLNYPSVSNKARSKQTMPHIMGRTVSWYDDKDVRAGVSGAAHSIYSMQYKSILRNACLLGSVWASRSHPHAHRKWVTRAIRIPLVILTRSRKVQVVEGVVNTLPIAWFRITIDWVISLLYKGKAVFAISIKIFTSCCTPLHITCAMG